MARGKMPPILSDFGAKRHRHRPGGKIDRISRRELPGCVKNPDVLHQDGTRRGEGRRFLRWKELDCCSALCYDESRETAGFFAVKDLLIKVK